MSNPAPTKQREGSQRVGLSGVDEDDDIILYVGKLTPGILWTSMHEWKHMMSLQAYDIRNHRCGFCNNGSHSIMLIVETLE